MKKVLLGLSVLLAGFSSANAQAFEANGKYLTLGLGGAQYWYIPKGGGTSAWNTGELNVQVEWGVHKYVGVGLFAGLGGGSTGSGGGYSSGIFNIPVGVEANFHFYQLIADKTGKNIYADKVDVYAGASLGTGLGIFATSGRGESYSSAAGMIWGGLHVGARYWWSPKYAANLELGYGKTFVNGGVVFKL